MTTLTPRDALEVVREYIGRSVLLDVGSKADEALSALTNLVERAGEPVAVIRSAKEPYGTRFLPEEWDRLENLPNGTRLIALPPTAPGASHER